MFADLDPADGVACDPFRVRTSQRMIDSDQAQSSSSIALGRTKTTSISLKASSSLPANDPNSVTFTGAGSRRRTLSRSSSKSVYRKSASTRSTRDRQVVRHPGHPASGGAFSPLDDSEFDKQRDNSSCDDGQ